MTTCVKALLGVGAIFSAIGASPALAQSVTGNVGSAGITEGESATEFRIGADSDGNVGARAHIQHAFTGWYQARIVTTFSDPDGGGWEFTGVTLENWFQWAEEADDNTGFDGGVRLSYIFRDGGGPDAAAVRLTFTDGFADRWEWRANLIGEMETGKGSVGGVDLETRAQVSRRVDSDFLGARRWRVGAEWFAEYGNSRDIARFSDQAHQIGPVLRADWKGGVVVQAGVRFGFTDGADDSMGKLSIARTF